jgi:hypothetical protein
MSKKSTSAPTSHGDGPPPSVDGPPAFVDGPPPPSVDVAVAAPCRLVLSGEKIFVYLCSLDNTTHMYACQSYYALLEARVDWN